MRFWNASHHKWTFQASSIFNSDKRSKLIAVHPLLFVSYQKIKQFKMQTHKTPQVETIKLWDMHNAFDVKGTIPWIYLNIHVYCICAHHTCVLCVFEWVCVWMSVVHARCNAFVCQTNDYLGMKCAKIRQSVQIKRCSAMKRAPYGRGSGSFKRMTLLARYRSIHLANIWTENIFYLELFGEHFVENRELRKFNGKNEHETFNAQIWQTFHISLISEFHFPRGKCYKTLHIYGFETCIHSPPLSLSLSLSFIHFLLWNHFDLLDWKKATNTQFM